MYSFLHMHIPSHTYTVLSHSYLLKGIMHVIISYKNIILSFADLLQWQKTQATQNTISTSNRSCNRAKWKAVTVHTKQSLTVILKVNGSDGTQ